MTTFSRVCETLCVCWCDFVCLISCLICFHCYTTSWCLIISSFYLHSLWDVSRFNTWMKQCWLLVCVAWGCLHVVYVHDRHKNKWSINISKWWAKHWLRLLASWSWAPTGFLNPYVVFADVLHVFVSLPAAADQPYTVVAEPHGGHAQPRGLGHEGETVSHRSGDQDVGHRLLRHPEAVQRGDPQVSFQLFTEC